MPASMKFFLRPMTALLLFLCGTTALPAAAQEAKYSSKPPLHGQHWMALAGKPLAATAGAGVFQQGGNAVDAACAMLAASATLWDSMGWGGETQALIFNPHTGEVHAINALGVAPSGATPDFFRQRGLEQPPDFGPLAAVTPGTPGGLLVMLAEFGTMSLAEVLQPALALAEGYPIERVVSEEIERNRPLLEQWPASTNVFLPNLDPDAPQKWAAPKTGSLFRQPDLLNTLHKLIAAERTALAAGATREEAIMAAYERFYRGDIARDLVAATQAAGGLITMEDLDQWQVHIEEPVMTEYHDIAVYKLNHWVQGPVLLQMLNMLEDMDLRSLGYNSVDYVHRLYQVMNLAFADRDFYYGDPYVDPEEPIAGLLSKDYARQRAALINPQRNSPDVRPGNPYPFQGELHPFPELLEAWRPRIGPPELADVDAGRRMNDDEGFLAGTTSIHTADAEGWVVSLVPSGGWIPAFVAGDTGIGLSQRMQSFDMERARNPYNVMQPGQRPRATLTPSLALRDGRPLLAFGVQGGDSQEQNLLQFFLNIVEFDMDVQQATEAANINSYQVHSSFGRRAMQPGRLLLRRDMDYDVMLQLQAMGYQIEVAEMTSGPITGIHFNQQEGTMMGGTSNFGDDSGLAW